MTDNERISKAQGLLCIHTQVECPKYDSDPAAWTPELYQWIEDEGLAIEFTMQVREIVIRESGTSGYLGHTEITWWILKATPAQKAQALAKAIEDKS